MKSYTFPVIFLCLAELIFWFKGNSKELYGIAWGPLKWWLYTSLFTNYLCLYAWWKLIELGDVWKAGVTWAFCGLSIELILNCYFFGFNWRGIVALTLCGLGVLVAHSG